MHRTPIEQLTIAVTTYRNTRAILDDQLAKALSDRNTAIVKALEAGARQRDVATTVGVGREQIRLIAKAIREARVETRS